MVAEEKIAAIEGADGLGYGRFEAARQWQRR
jgi:hypothetical protein